MFKVLSFFAFLLPLLFGAGYKNHAEYENEQFEFVHEDIAPGVELFEYKSMGFNTVEESYRGNTIFEYYLLNHPKYSNAFMIPEYEGPEEGFSNPSVRYEIPEKRREGEWRSTREFTLLGSDRQSISLDWGDRFSYAGQLKKILTTPESVTKIYSNSTIVKYYNIPALEMEQKYLTEFVKDIRILLCPVPLSLLKIGAKDQENFLICLPRLKRDELAIIRNCLFAKRGYKFESGNWKEFMATYYSPTYKGFYSEEETLALFTDDEKWFLNLILERERTPAPVGNAGYEPPFFPVLVSFVAPEGYFANIANYQNTMEEHLNGATRFEYFLLEHPQYSDAQILPRVTENERTSSVSHLRYEIPEKSQNGEPSGATVLSLLDSGTRRQAAPHSFDLPKIHYTTCSTREMYSPDFVRKFYDIPSFEVEQKYLTEFVRDIKQIVRSDNLSLLRREVEQNKQSAAFLVYLPYFKKDGLAIIRNCLFAKRGYKFEIDFWKQFMAAYYSETYSGVYTNEETLALFTDDERWFLRVILEHEKRQNATAE